MKNIAIILASGNGSRLRAEKPKQFLKLAGKTVLEHTLDAFEHHAGIDEVIIVCAEENRLLVEEVLGRSGHRKPGRIVRGGDTRQASSASGIAAVVGDDHKVLVHDAARPLLDQATINRCLDALDDYDAVDTGIPSGDTIIQLDQDEQIAAIPQRSMLRLGQTPQAFRSGLLRQAHQHFEQSDTHPTVTDDCGLVLHYGLAPIKVVDGDINNIKITYPSDIYLADRLFQLRARCLEKTDIAGALKDKVLVVFGASRGIGQRIAGIAESHGAHVHAVSRNTGVDITNANAVRDTLQTVKAEYGRVDMVANTAGILRTGLVADQDYETISQEVDINVRGSIVVAKEAHDAMQQTGGSIALFTSSSYTRGRARSAVYAATKAAVVNLMQGLSTEYAPDNVHINAINPERTHTPMRTENFGIEPAEELLDAEKVARSTLAVMLSDTTGEVIDVRR